MTSKHSLAIAALTRFVITLVTSTIRGVVEACLHVVADSDRDDGFAISLVVDRHVTATTGPASRQPSESS